MRTDAGMKLPRPAASRTLSLLPLLLLSLPAPLRAQEGPLGATDVIRRDLLGEEVQPGRGPQLVLDLDWKPDEGRGWLGTLLRGPARAADHNFFDLPFPLDARRRANGAPDLSGLPVPRRTRWMPLPRKKTFLQRAWKLAEEETCGYSPSGAIYFRFDGALRHPGEDPLLRTRPGSPVLLVDIDPASPEHLRRHPALVAITEAADSMRPAHLLQLLPVPGLDLRPGTRYAALVLRELGAPGGLRLTTHPALLQLLRGERPAGRRGAELQRALAPLAEALPRLGLRPEDVAAATVFTTGDPAGRLIRQVSHVARQAPPRVERLEVRREVQSEVFTALRGTYRVPQYQEGVAPYVIGGFVPRWLSRLGIGRLTIGRILGDGSQRLDRAGMPVEVRTAKTEFQLSIPRGKMPRDGFPLYFYVHGTGGSPREAIDRGRKSVKDQQLPPGLGYARLVGQEGWATACVATGFSPDRIGWRAADGYLAYNFLNPVAMRDNFLQMVLELVHFRNLVLGLTIDPALCPGTDASAAPDGKVRFDPRVVVVSGQSLGSYLSGILAATLPGWRGAILTGAGGSWIEFPFGPKDPMDMSKVLSNLSLPRGERLDRFHPLITVFDTALGPADNAHYWRHVVREPLPGHVAPHVLVIEGEEDLQVALNTQRALVLGIGVDLAGPDAGQGPAQQLTPVLEWAGLRQLDYPVRGNRTLPDGSRRTAVVVRYPADSVQLDGHYVAFQLLEPQRQVVEFLRGIRAGEVPTVIDGRRPGRNPDLPLTLGPAR